MEAISQLLSADPVVKEREDLARIKEAIKNKVEKEAETPEEEEEEKERMADKTTSTTTTTPDKKEKIEKISTFEDMSDETKAATIIQDMEAKAAEEATKSTLFTTKADEGADVVTATTVSPVSSEKTTTKEVEPEDPVVARLKRRIESMVNKIENQLSAAHLKIGEKLHYLDKDMDGILSREEMAQVLSQVFKNISSEKALEIADGIVSVKCNITM
jgi:SpoU rRNA methylase family enzyme